MYYELTTLTVRPGTTPSALPRLKEWLASTPSAGRLLACWFTELGALNQILLMRSYGDSMLIGQERDSNARSSNPFGIADLLTAAAADTYISLPFMPRIEPGNFGPVFEVRTYTLKPDGLAKTIQLWEAAVPNRIKLSTLLGALYSISGATPRFVHIWPYESLNARQTIRSEAVKMRIWPPPGGPDQLVSQQADIYFAAPFSPIQ
jgi:hypothetical protein